MDINKKTYHKIYELVKNLVINNDPAGLIDGGAPNDEYDAVINSIVSKLKDCDSESSVKELIEKEFVGVGSIINKDNCAYIAQKIFQKIEG